MENQDITMTQPLWQKSGIQIDAKIMQFLAGDDVLLDREFFLHDITASKAHVEGLANIGVVSADEAAALKRELDALADDFASGAFVLDERYEDGHSAIARQCVSSAASLSFSHSRVATRIWSLRLRPVCTRRPASPRRSVSRASIAE